MGTKRVKILRGDEHNCLMCGEPIPRFRKSKKTCSDKCRKRLERWKKGRKVQMKLVVNGNEVQW